MLSAKAAATDTSMDKSALLSDDEVSLILTLQDPLSEEEIKLAKGRIGDYYPLHDIGFWKLFPLITQFMSVFRCKTQRATSVAGAPKPTIAKLPEELEAMLRQDDDALNKVLEENKAVYEGTDTVRDFKKVFR